MIGERKELVKRFGTEYGEYKSEVPRRYLAPFLAVYLGITATAYVARLILLGPIVSGTTRTPDLHPHWSTPRFA